MENPLIWKNKLSIIEGTWEIHNPKINERHIVNIKFRLKHIINSIRK